MRSQANTFETARIGSSCRLLDVGETTSFLGGIGRTKLYELVKSGELSPVHIGRRTFFRQSDLEAFITSLLQPYENGQAGQWAR
jgi:excisionase family DNA binding protein